MSPATGARAAVRAASSKGAAPSASAAPASGASTRTERVEIANVATTLNQQAHGLRTATPAQFGQRMVRLQRAVETAEAWLERHGGNPQASQYVGPIRGAVRSATNTIVTQARARGITVAGLEQESSAARERAREIERRMDTMGLPGSAYDEPAPPETPPGGAASWVPWVIGGVVVLVGGGALFMAIARRRAPALPPGEAHAAR